MSSVDFERYQAARAAVALHIQQLRTVFESAEAKCKERVWFHNQSAGDLDDRKLVDGVLGEK